MAWKYKFPLVQKKSKCSFTFCQSNSSAFSQLSPTFWQFNISLGLIKRTPSHAPDGNGDKIIIWESHIMGLMLFSVIKVILSVNDEYACEMPPFQKTNFDLTFSEGWPSHAPVSHPAWGYNYANGNMFSPKLKQLREKLSLNARRRGMNVPCTWVWDYPAAVSHPTEGEPQGRVERGEGDVEESGQSCEKYCMSMLMFREILYEWMFWEILYE